MRIRVAFGMIWSLVVGLAGGWLVFSPWALGEQSGNNWSNVTQSEVGAGLGLILLGVIGLFLVVAGMARRGDAGVARPRGASGSPATDPEMEQALLELAQRLSRELAEPRNVPSSEPHEPAWRERQ